MEMEGLAHLHVQTMQTLPIKSIKSVGSLELVQKEAITELVTARKLVKTLYESSVFEKLQYVSAGTLLREYYDRNETTVYSYQQPII